MFLGAHPIKISGKEAVDGSGGNGVICVRKGLCGFQKLFVSCVVSVFKSRCQSLPSYHSRLWKEEMPLLVPSPPTLLCSVTPAREFFPLSDRTKKYQFKKILWHFEVLVCYSSSTKSTTTEDSLST